MSKVRSFATIWLAICLVIAGAAAGSQMQAQVVVSQVYGGGGNSGATYRNDFVELLNTGSQPVLITNWSVQYASSTGSSWQTTNLSGTLQPGRYYLVQESQGAGGTANLPTPDASGSIAMSATAGKIALVNTTVALSGACPSGTSIINLVGFGSAANCSQVAPTATLSNTTAALRKGSGCTNDGNNSTDFETAAPAPRNSASPLNPCSAGGGITIAPTVLPDATVNVNYSATLIASGGTGPYTFQLGGALPDGFSLSPNGVLSGITSTVDGSPFVFTVIVTDANARTASAGFTLSVSGQATCNPTTTIAAIQGSGVTSPVNGQTVTISGVVTGRDNNGFFLQMPAPGDGDLATSDGIYVYTSSSRLPAIAQPGNSVCVAGPVGEFAPSSDPNSPTNTEINGATSVTLLASGNPVPAPVVLTLSDTDPVGSLYQLEKYEGMRVQVAQLNVVGPTGGSVNEVTATATSDGTFYGVLPGIPRPFREPGVQLPDALPAGAPANVPRWDTNPEIISVDTGGLSFPLDVTSGAVVSNITGPLTYSGRAYTIVVEAGSTPVASGNVTGSPLPVPSPDLLTISAFNLERFYNTGGADPGTSHPVPTAAAFANRLSKASLAIRNVLKTPDILAVEEVQNLATLRSIADKVNSDAVANAQPNPNYIPYLSLGNDISGINSGFLVKTPKVTVTSVTQYGKAATYTNPGGTQSTLNDRPPLVLQASVLRPGSDAGLPVIVVVNHLRSLLSLNDPSSGTTVRAKREAQAEFLANLIQGFQAADPQANIVSVGDYNAFQFSDGFVDSIGVIKGTPAAADQVVLAGPRLVNPVLTDLIDSSFIAPADRYSYTFTGSAQALDHMIVNENMLSRTTAFTYARNDADFPETFRNDPNRPERVSDHDIPQGRFTLPLIVTSKVQVSNTGFIYSRVSRTYVGTIRITNTSSAAVDGPVLLTLTNLPGGVSVAGGSTFTSGSLLPGQSASFTVQFTNPSNLPIGYTPVVSSGTP